MAAARRRSSRPPGYPDRVRTLPALSRRSLASVRPTPRELRETLAAWAAARPRMAALADAPPFGPAAGWWGAHRGSDSHPEAARPHRRAPAAALKDLLGLLLLLLLLRGHGLRRGGPSGRDDEQFGAERQHASRARSRSAA